MKGDGGEEAVMMQGGLGYVAELGVTAAAGGVSQEPKNDGAEAKQAERRKRGVSYRHRCCMRISCVLFAQSQTKY